MAPVFGVPPWDALVTELGSAPSDRVVAEPARSTIGLWAILVALTAVMFVPMVAGVAGVADVAGALFPAGALLVCLIWGLVLHESHRRRARASCVPLASLGLRLIEPPAGGIFRWLFSVKLSLRGRRFGHAVLVEVDLTLKRAGPTGASVVTVAAPSPSFALAGKDGQLLAGVAAPAPVLALCDAIGLGPWDDVAVTAGPAGISVVRGATWTWSVDVTRERRWLYDLWLAEHLARAVSSGG